MCVKKNDQSYSKSKTSMKKGKYIKHMTNKNTFNNEKRRNKNVMVVKDSRNEGEGIANR